MYIYIYTYIYIYMYIYICSGYLQEISLDVLQVDLKETGSEGVDGLHLAQERFTVMNFPVP
jgi:hypothetical protein